MASTAEGDVGTVTELTGVLQWGFRELSLNYLATSLGASEQALRLIISIFLGKDPRASFRPLAESAGNGDVTSPSSRSQPGGLCGVHRGMLKHASRLFIERQVLSGVRGCRALGTSSPFSSSPAVPFIGRHHPRRVPAT